MKTPRTFKSTDIDDLDKKLEWLVDYTLLMSSRSRDEYESKKRRYKRMTKSA